MAETATRRRNGTAPKDEPAAKPRTSRNGAATKPKAARGETTKAKTKPAANRGGAKSRSASKPRSAQASGDAAKKTSSAAKSRNAPAAASGSRRRAGGSGSGGGGSKSASPLKRSARKAVDAVEDLAPSVSATKHPVRKLALASLRKMAKAALGGVAEAGAGAIRAAADRAAATGHEAVEKTAHKRLPIQRSVDIAVPLRVAWEEWSALDSIPEGVHTVTDIERDGAELFGHTSGPRKSDWSAEILDERPEQSFAWQSHEGSDCAGLITFHELSRRLTRVELNLDVVPTGPLETAQLAMKLADRHAETELRRFKARLELINPDLYEDEEADADEDEEPGEPGESDAPEDAAAEDDADAEDEPPDPDEAA